MEMRNRLKSLTIGHFFNLSPYEFHVEESSGDFYNNPMDHFSYKITLMDTEHKLWYRWPKEVGEPVRKLIQEALQTEPKFFWSLVAKAESFENRAQWKGQNVKCTGKPTYNHSCLFGVCQLCQSVK